MASDDHRERILAVHCSARVRGAIHRSLTQLDLFSISLAPNIEDARTHCFRHRPSAVVLRFDDRALEWAIDLHSRQLVSVIFCYTKGDDMMFCKQARDVGLEYFVELPGDFSASWAREAGRIGKTIQRSIEMNRARRKVFARSTVVQPAVLTDLVASRTTNAKRENGARSEGTKRDRSHVGRTTMIQEVTSLELAASCKPKNEEQANTEATSKPCKARKEKTKQAASKPAKEKKRRRKKQIAAG